DIDEVVVARKNQLYINVDDTESGELAEDLLSIITIFMKKEKIDRNYKVDLQQSS
ncbi:3366_t:CDS:2, partial [Racocetra persica]